MSKQNVINVVPLYNEDSQLKTRVTAGKDKSSC